MRVKHAKKDLEKYPRPFFMSEADRNIQDDLEIDLGIWLIPTVHVSSDTLYRAIAETEMLTDWLEEYLQLGINMMRVID